MISVPMRPRAMKAWLTSPSVLLSDGSVMSWSNPSHEGYAYPEIAGLLLSWLSSDTSDTRSIRPKVAERLALSIGSNGGIVRWGQQYVFDSAMVLSGLLAHRRAGGCVPEGLSERLYGFICEQLTARRGIASQTNDPLHWSNSYGCHLLKTAMAVSEYSTADRATHRRTSMLVEQILGDLRQLQDASGRFRIHEGSYRTYLHAHCYATEGLLYLDAIGGSPGLRPSLEKSADWLARVQDPSGGLRAWHDGVSGEGNLHTDCSAQAIRIWVLVNPDRYWRNIERGLEFLSTMSTPSGGLRYEPGSEDVNTWATIFGIQALQWALERAGDARGLI